MPERNLVWVVDDDESIRWVLEKGLSENGLKVETFESAHQVIKKLEEESPGAILSDIKMPGTSGLALLDQVKEIRPDIITNYLYKISQVFHSYYAETKILSSEIKGERIALIKCVDKIILNGLQLLDIEPMDVM